MATKTDQNYDPYSQPTDYNMELSNLMNLRWNKLKTISITRNQGAGGGTWVIQYDDGLGSPAGGPTPTPSGGAGTS